MSALPAADADENAFAGIVRAAEKQHLQLHLQVVAGDTYPRTLMVSSPHEAVGYRASTSWQVQFRADLENGRFG